MIVHIETLHQQPQDFSIDIPADECHLPDDVGVSSAAIHLDIRLRRIQEEITVEGRISARLEMACSRCLRVHDEFLDDTFELMYLPQPVVKHGMDEVELEEAELNVSYYDGDTLELAEIAREQLLLLLPVKPLCKEDCAGLCPSCGQDFNEGYCDCPKDVGDPRFAVLKSLLTPGTTAGM